MGCLAFIEATHFFDDHTFISLSQIATIYVVVGAGDEGSLIGIEPQS